MIEKEQELRAEIERLKGLLAGDPDIIKLLFDKQNGFEMSIKHWAVRLFAHSLWKSFDQEGGPNFLSLDIGGIDERGPIEVTIRPKWGTKTPTELLNAAKAEIERLKSGVTQD